MQSSAHRVQERVSHSPVTGVTGAANCSMSVVGTELWSSARAASHLTSEPSLALYCLFLVMLDSSHKLFFFLTFHQIDLLKSPGQ